MSVNYIKDIKVNYSDMDCNLILKPSALLNFLQDAASDNADEFDFGYKFVRSRNLAWYLLKYRMEFVNYPENKFNIKVLTCPRGYNKLFAFRDFEILDENNNLLGRVASSWALVDLTTKEIASPANVLKDCSYMVPFEKNSDDLSYSKIHLPEKFSSKKTFEIRFDDLDVNKHVNNSNYIIWAFETLDFNFRNSNKLKSLDINFKKEISYGFSVSSEACLDNNTSVHLIKNKNTGDDLCLIKAEWIKVNLTNS